MPLILKLKMFSSQVIIVDYYYLKILLKIRILSTILTLLIKVKSQSHYFLLLDQLTAILLLSHNKSNGAHLTIVKKELILEN
jgi:hypothetical protein